MRMTEQFNETESKPGEENKANSSEDLASDSDNQASSTNTHQADEHDPAKIAKDWENKYLYLYAEFENFRKRVAKEKQDFFKFGHEDFLRELLLVQDNFERALTHSENASDESAKLIVEGLKMIMLQFADALKAQGVTKVKTVGEKFDPNIHEAVAQEESDAQEAGTILKEHLAGYTLHGRLLRAAKVVTAIKPNS